MLEIRTLPGDDIRNTIRRALPKAPCWFDFNGIKITITEDMKTHPDAPTYLYDYYHCGIGNEPFPQWPPKGKEKPCKACGRNNFITDKKCWWCETSNPCT